MLRDAKYTIEVVGYRKKDGKPFRKLFLWLWNPNGKHWYKAFDFHMSEINLDILQALKERELIEERDEDDFLRSISSGRSSEQ